MTLEVDISLRLGDLQIEAMFGASSGVTALFGRSGAGKTSIVNMIAGLLRPDRGRIAVDGRTLIDSELGIFVPAHRRCLGYVFQDGRLFPHLTVRQNLSYGSWFKKEEADSEAFDQVSSLLDLERLLKRFPVSLSGGEKQRVAIGRALLANPKLLLMDEPLASLDDHRKQEIIPYIERLRDQYRVPIVYVSHSMDEVARLANTIVLVSNGKVEASGSVGEILTRTDLFPLTGRFEAGSVINCLVAGKDAETGLLKLDSKAGSLLVPAGDVATGRELRVRIRARDVMISIEQPEGLSAINVLQARVAEIRSSPPFADIRLDAGGENILARITNHSVGRLGLGVGASVYAVVKSTNFDRKSLGLRKSKKH